MIIQWWKIISFDFHHIPKLSIGFNYLCVCVCVCVCNCVTVCAIYVCDSVSMCVIVNVCACVCKWSQLMVNVKLESQAKQKSTIIIICGRYENTVYTSYNYTERQKKLITKSSSSTLTKIRRNSPREAHLKIQRIAFVKKEKNLVKSQRVI